MYRKSLRRLADTYGIPKELLLEAAIFEFLALSDAMRFDILKRYLEEKFDVHATHGSRDQSLRCTSG